MRRDWGAPPQPKPASERRAEAGELQSQPAAPHQPAPPLHPFLRPPRPQHGGRSPGKAGPLPKLGGASASPRGELPPMKSAWLAQQQQGAAAAAAVRRKQQAAADAQPAGEATIAALRRTSPAPQPLPSISPEASQRSAAPAWLTPAASPGVPDGEDEDAVLIGSVAPSFSLPHAQPAALPSTSPLAAQRRSGLLSSQLGSEDLSLTALAAASRRVTRYSSASGGSSLPSSLGSRAVSVGADTSAPEPAMELSGPNSGDCYAADFEAESPGAGGSAQPPPPAPQPARQSAQLSSGELALLRQSLLELRLPGGPDADCSSSADAAACDSAEGQEIPDKVVLRELGARLGRLDSAKRRVLLQVLAKLDAAPAGAAEAATGSAPEERRSSPSSGSDGRASAGSSVAGSAGALAASEGQCNAAPLSNRSLTSSRGAAVLPPAQTASQSVVSEPEPPPQLPIGVSAGRPVAAPVPAAGAAPPAAQQSPSKPGGLMSRLAALRLGRTSSLGKASSTAAAAAAAEAHGPPQALTAAHGASPQQHPAQLAGSVSRGSSLGHSTGTSGLQGLAQQRHRSRLSVDGLPTGRQQGVGPAAAVAALHGSPAGGASQQGGGDSLAAFEQQHAGDEAPPALSASPTVLALGGWQQAEQQAGSTSRARSGSGGSEVAAFAIPACPSGRVLELRISSTWGDHHFVGLTGIELFDSRGQLLTVRDPARQVSASPPSINVLPEYGSDPRTPDKLLDGVNLTCDCAHMWLAPFTPGALHTVTVTLDAAAALGALRVWNYSKSRVGALRGARHVELALDGAVIFRGEVRQAPGSVAGALQAAELVLFTEDPAALAAIEQHDKQRYLRQLSPPGSGGDAASCGVAPAAAAAAQLDLVTAGGPASPRGRLARTATLPVLGQPGQQQLGADGRPLTSAQYLPPALPAASAAAGSPHDQRRATASSRGSSTGAARSPGSGGGAGLLHCRELTFILMDTWGDSHFVGLSGLQVLGADRQPLPLSPAQLAADPLDLNVFPGHKGDIRTVDKVVDGNNCTMDDTSMWLAPVRRQLSASVAAGAQRQRAAGGSAMSVDRSTLPEAARPYNVLLVRLAPPVGGSSGVSSGGSSSSGGGSGVAVSGLRVWNYNKSLQDTARGVKRMVVLADGVEVSPPGGVLLRRAPGDAACDFGQFIPLTTAWSAAAVAASKARRRSTLQPGGAPAVQQQQQQLVIHPESLAWACSLPDPAAALDCIQRAALLAKAAGPGGTLVGQPGECFATTLPCGFSLKLVLLSSWGCPHYIGLSGLEVHDAVRGPLHTRPDQVWAAPASVAAADVRTPDKLVDGDCSGTPQHSWLAPLDRQEGNIVRLMLDRPVLLSAIRVWNYARTPSRGVQEMEVYLDEQLVWKGVLQRAPAELAAGEDFAQTLCFSEEAVQEAAAAARRRAATRPAGSRHGGTAASAAVGSLPGAPLGAEGVEEWCEQQERVVLFNNGYVEPPTDCSMPPSARPATALVAA